MCFAAWCWLSDILSEILLFSLYYYLLIKFTGLTQTDATLAHTVPFLFWNTWITVLSMMDTAFYYNLSTNLSLQDYRNSWVQSSECSVYTLFCLFFAYFHFII